MKQSELYSLPEDELHVWQADLRKSPDEIAGLIEILSGDEKQRAGRLRVQQRKQRFIAARGILRLILSRYLNSEPADMRFIYNDHGKPGIDCELVTSRLEFNLSHTGDLGFIAVCSGRRIGVDVETIGAGDAYEKIPERFFSSGEVDTLRSLPEEQQRSAFYACWTRKEAYRKARGQGIALPLNDFTVSLKPGEPAALLQSSLDTEEVSQWTIVDINLGPGYRAAVAVEGNGLRMVHRQWVDS